MTIEVYVEPDSPIYFPGDKAVAKILFENLKDSNVTLGYRVSILFYSDHVGEVLFEEEKSLQIMPGGRQEIIVEASVPGNRIGKIVFIIEAYWNSMKIVDSVESLVVWKPEYPIGVSIVWHHHQAPNYLPNGQYHADWAFRWVWYDLFKPYYKGGPYYVHASIQNKYPSLRITQHLSPSLLKQWSNAVEDGYRLVSGEYYPPGSREVEMVKETLELYRKLLSKNRIEVLTSVYAHTILGYLVSKYDMVDVVLDELELGKEVTRKIMGVEATGAWTPEMAWDQRLAELYRSHGIDYTVLCGKNHFPGSRGSKKDIYQPYLTTSNLAVFFRDQAISDTIGFGNIFPDEKTAYRKAANIVVEIAQRGLTRRKPSHITIALDGENWMIFSKTPHNTALFLDKFYHYLSILESKGLLKTVFLSQALDEIGVQGSLEYIPTTSWLGSFHKWHGERREHDWYWRRTYRGYRLIRVYEHMIEKRDQYSGRARWALYHALDSDYWWAEFWNQKVIEEWLHVLEETLTEAFSKIVIYPKPTSTICELGVESCINIVVENHLEKTVRLTLVLAKTYAYTTPVTVKANPGKTEHKLCFTPRTWGKMKIPVLALAQNYVVAATLFEADIYPRKQV